jgi:sec-independent protein translocase protein TatA
VFLLILDSLGSTELLFILLMALVFFGPRKLPQLSRSLGKNLAEFRKASEDFKRTWEREVALESSESEITTDRSMPLEDNSILNGAQAQAPDVPMILPAPDEQVIASPPHQETATSTDFTGESANTPNTSEPAHLEPSRKQDWL